MKKKHGLNKKPFVIKDIKTANKKNQNFYNKNYFSDEFENILSQITAEAAVDPKQLTLLSTILGRKLKQEKLDTREYNIKFISFNDLQTIELMDSGLKFDFFPGDSLKVYAKKNKDNGDDFLFNRLQKAIDEKDYSSFPFLSYLAEDIRTRYLLRTDATDTYDNLIEEISKVRSKYLSDEDWAVLLKAMKQAESRLEKEEVLFLEPLPDGGVSGKLKKLSDKDRKEYNLASFYTFMDIRTDSHDLVSLKELLYCMNGNLVDHLSVFSGAFSKYIPELNQLGYRGVVSFVEKGKLVSIKLSPMTKESIPFGPIEAALALSEAFGGEGKIVTPGKKYYVTVNGFVAGPNDKTKSFSYDTLFPVNNEIIPAAETFLFQSDGLQDGVMTTRLYFYAHKPKLLNLFHQQMTVVVGSSDQMFNSCAYDPSRSFYSPEVKADFLEKILHEGYDNEPGVKAVKQNFLDEDTPPGVIAVDAKYNEFGRLCSDSVYGENKYTYLKYLKIAKTMPSIQGFVNIIEEQGLLKNSLPLTSRFVVYNYLAVKNGGLTREAQATTFRKIKRYSFQEMVDSWSMDIRLNQKSTKLLELLKKNVPLSDAFNESFDEDEQNYMESGKLPPKKK